MLPSFRLIVATFCCGFIMVFAGLRLATSINGINQAMPVMAAHAAPAMVSAISDQELRRSPATVPVMYDLRFAVSATQPAPTPTAASPVIDRATPLMMPLVILPPIAQEAATSEQSEAAVIAALPASPVTSPVPEPAPLVVDIPLPEPVTVDLTFSPPAKPQQHPAVATVAPQATPLPMPQSAPAIDIPLPEPAIIDLTLPPPVKRESEADGRGGAGQEQQQEKRSETDARSNQPLTVAALDIPVGTVELPTKAIPLPRPKGVLRAATVQVANAKPRRKTVRTSQRNDFDSLFGMSSGNPR
jgi:hypothetical protein